ncbi:dienelactone hydrolase family protein [Streptomyces ipomoeae]|jgi:pimeloyl-ACP methyl ester carboxylesterase|uniref:dienelactone hydrolase family protein n=1 Tax=Streptomyces ipomoeae TaxID=103232 RepID=UPI001146B5DE|nr:alpha/beta family hydrolase [Streptomyces ipomoeae]MDX2825382.1 dienelactone hydrolase family protein [Streptomyces ipomoeae]MDX2877113.1 dienelactone hydrolase family protein [Streptomyces ipomoeae]MDX2937579.1 dienelactone hydrolase family protein [Streptomyces ipomoeae]TQE29168.1 hydrolase [Streptomyces ipomoeae]
MISQTVMVPVDGEALAGDVEVPGSARAVVLFAHGSGSSRHSPRNRMVAARLRAAGLGTVLMDLLTEREELDDEWTAEYRFDIPLLGSRLAVVIDWLEGQHDTKGLPVALFGASTGAAAALVAAAERPDRVLTVVSRGGRPDLAGDALDRVRAPVLLIVGGRDPEVLRLNQEAARLLKVPHSLHVVPDATHLFEEPGALEKVADEARAWCEARLASLPGTDD